MNLWWCFRNMNPEFREMLSFWWRLNINSTFYHRWTMRVLAAAERQLKTGCLLPGALDPTPRPVPRPTRKPTTPQPSRKPVADRRPVPSPRARRGDGVCERASWFASRPRAVDASLPRRHNAQPKSPATRRASPRRSRRRSRLDNLHINPRRSRRVSLQRNRRRGRPPLDRRRSRRRLNRRTRR